MKKLKFILTSLFLVAVLALAVPTTVYADDGGPQGGSNSTKGAPPPPPPPTSSITVEMIFAWMLGLGR
jgi:hypothetical protein